MNLREAAEMAFTELCNQRDAHYTKDIPTELAQAIQVLRQALAQPKRKWVGLTDDDIHDAFNYVEMVKLLDFDRDRPEWCEAFARACEARLRHRNGEKQ
jgi:hypothetical protein